MHKILVWLLSLQSMKLLICDRSMMARLCHLSVRSWSLLAGFSNLFFFIIEIQNLFVHNPGPFIIITWTSKLTEPSTGLVAKENVFSLPCSLKFYSSFFISWYLVLYLNSSQFYWLWEMSFPSGETQLPLVVLGYFPLA